MVGVPSASVINRLLRRRCDVDDRRDRGLLNNSKASNAGLGVDLDRAIDGLRTRRESLDIAAGSPEDPTRQKALRSKHDCFAICLGTVSTAQLYHRQAARGMGGC